MKIPHQVLYEKDADLSLLKIAEDKAFVHIKNPTKLEGMLCGFSKKVSNAYHV